MDVWVAYAQYIFKRQDGRASVVLQPRFLVYTGDSGNSFSLEGHDLPALIWVLDAGSAWHQV